VIIKTLSGFKFQVAGSKTFIDEAIIGWTGIFIYCLSWIPASAGMTKKNQVIECSSLWRTPDQVRGWSRSPALGLSRAEVLPSMMSRLKWTPWQFETCNLKLETYSSRSSVFQ
jgi:hypothetical protein